jgi:anti-sigma-K factor RskA
MTGHDPFDDAPAAFALDALDPAERQAFVEHLSTCVRCQRDVIEFRRVAAALGASADPMSPPESLKARTMARVLARPERRPEAGVSGRAPSLDAWRWRTSWLAAAALALAVGVSVYAGLLRSQVRLLHQMVADASARADALRDEVRALRRDSSRLLNTVNVLSAPDVRRVNLTGLGPAPSATGRAYMSQAHGLVIAAAALPALPAGRVYQLWVIPPGGAAPISAGLLSVDAAGAASFAAPLPPGATRIMTVAVTNEPGPAGSPGPTSAPLLAGSVAGGA